MTIPDLIKEELETRPHQWIDWSELLRNLKHDRRFEGSYLGSYSCTLKDKSVTYVSHRHTWCGEPVSASTIARQCMKPVLTHLGRKRLFWTRYEKPYLEIPQPLFCKPEVERKYLIYVDVKACYFDLYRRMPVAVRWGGRMVHYGDTSWGQLLPSDIEQYKLVRNSIPGIWRAYNGCRVRHGKPVSVGTINPYLSPIHWGLLAHLLHHLAAKAVSLGAVYYNTDGAIFVDDKAALAWVDLVADLGLTASVRHQGIGKVYAVGSYQIGGQRWGGNKDTARAFSNLGYFNPQVLTAWKEWIKLYT